MTDIIPQELIEKKIYLVRGQKIMLDKDLADLYGVETRVLNQAVKRNVKRFPADFVFRVSQAEAEKLSRSQFVILKRGHNIKYLPYAFTENGVAMLSSVLKSDRAIAVNIQIMRTFTKIRKMLASNARLARKLEALEKKYDEKFKVVFEAIYKLMEQPKKPKRQIGFKREKEYNKPLQLLEQSQKLEPLTVQADQAIQAAETIIPHDPTPSTYRY